MKYICNEDFYINEFLVGKKGDVLEITNAVPRDDESETLEDVKGYCDIFNVTKKQLFESTWNDIDTDILETLNYYEIEFSHEEFDDTKNIADSYSICIIANHHPSLEEAKEFCKSDMEKFGYEHVISVTTLNYEEAHKFFDMENENEFPILK